MTAADTTRQRSRSGTVGRGVAGGRPAGQTRSEGSQDGQGRPGMQRRGTTAGSGEPRIPDRPRPTRGGVGLLEQSPAPRGRPASVRGRRQRRVKPLRVDHQRRGRFAFGAMLVLLLAATVKIVTIQTVDASGYAAAAAAQRDHTVTLPATRGAIYDRTGTPLAFTVQGDAIAAFPALFKSDTQRMAVATILVDGLGSTVSAATIMTQLTDGKSPYVYLARGLMPAETDALMAKITPLLHGTNAVVTERQDLRQYPQGTITQALIGATGWDGHGTGGVEIKYDTLLGGTDGSRTVDIDARGQPIPGTSRDETAAVDGGDVTLTIDANLQYTAAQMLNSALVSTGAKGGSAVVMSVKDAQIYAMVSDHRGETAAQVGNLAVTTPFEPGSVAKVITFAAALDHGLITPTTHFAVPDSIEIGGHTVHDAWPHSRVGMTATGILAKSSNVGTLMLAQQVGEDRFFAQLTKFGLGQKSGIQLPADSAGSVPPLSQWSATSFANLPIGQGVSVTLVQLADMYQAIANGGVRVPATIVASTTKDGVTTADPRPQGRPGDDRRRPRTRCSDMLRGTVQGGDILHDGTAPKAALTGYQVAGKTGTAQQVDPKCGCYSETLVNATFAGILPADNPQFVIAVMLDAPAGGAEAGAAAAPLFHDIAAYTMRAVRRPAVEVRGADLPALHQPGRVALPAVPPASASSSHGRDRGSAAPAGAQRDRRRRRVARSGADPADAAGHRDHAAQRRGATGRPVRGAAGFGRPRRGVRRRSGAARAPSPCSPIRRACDDARPAAARPGPRCWWSPVPGPCSGRPLPLGLRRPDGRGSTVIGVTGTSGKTTTSFLVEAGAGCGRAHHRADRHGRRPGSPDGPLPSALTTPEAPDLQALFAVMRRAAAPTPWPWRCPATRWSRAGSPAPGSRSARSPTCPRTTWTSTADMENYFEAKQLLFDGRAAAEVVDDRRRVRARLAALRPATP